MITVTVSSILTDFENVCLSYVLATYVLIWSQAPGQHYNVDIAIAM